MESRAERWEGRVSTRLTRASADQIWSLFGDYADISKWFPGLTTSYIVSGTNGEVGCVRYCAGNSFQPPGGGDASLGWSNERLAAIDRKNRTLTYEILDNNIGFNNYVATFRIIPVMRDDGCIIEWSWGVDPVEGSTFDEMVSNYNKWLQEMAETMEDALVGAIRKYRG